MVSSEIVFGTVVPCLWFEPKLASQFDAEIASRIAGIPGPAVRNACFPPPFGGYLAGENAPMIMLCIYSPRVT